MIGIHLWNIGLSVFCTILGVPCFLRIICDYYNKEYQSSLDQEVEAHSFQKDHPQHHLLSIPSFSNSHNWLWVLFAYMLGKLLCTVKIVPIFARYAALPTFLLALLTSLAALLTLTVAFLDYTILVIYIIAGFIGAISGS